MEKFDLYDDDRLPLNRSLTRGTTCGENENRMVVHVCIFNSKGEMLIQQRVSTKKSWPNLWDITLGGCATTKETSKDAAHRELLEELGIDYDFSHTRPHLTINFPHGFDDYYLLSLDSLDISTITLQKEEVSAIKWASKEDIIHLLKENKFIPYHQSFVLSLFDIKDQYGVIKD